MVQNYDNHGILKNRRVNNPNLVPNLVTQVTRPDTISSGITKPGSVIEFVNSTVGTTQIVVNVGDDLQRALDNINSVGGGIVFVRDGMHIFNNDIITYSKVTIQGETAEGTIIDFNGTASGIRIKGTNAYTTGTVSVNVNTSNVTGVGTSWNQNMVGLQIFLGQLPYTIESVSSTTALTIVGTFTPTGVGGNLSGASYAIANPINDVLLSSLTVQNSTDKLVDVEYAGFIGVLFEKVLFTGGNYGLYVNYCGSTRVSFGGAIGNNYGMYFYNSDSISLDTLSNNSTVIGDNVYMNNSGDSTLFNCSFTNANGNGVTFVNGYNTNVLACTINANTGKGVEMVSGTNSVFLESSSCSSNGSDGVKLTATDNNNIISKLVCSGNGGYGINIANANCNTNIILGNNLFSNTAGQMANSGTNTKIRSNIGVADV